MKSFHALISALMIGLAAASGRGAEPAASASPRLLSTEALSRPLTVELNDARLEDVVKFVELMSGVSVRPMWLDDRSTDGLDPDLRISVAVTEGSMIDLIDDVLEQASDDFSESTWQISPRGELQIGPRSRLNRYKEIRLYDVRDLLNRLPDFSDAPDIDIDAALQQGRGAGGGGGGGGGGSIIREPEGDDPDLGTAEETSADLIQLIENFVETDQWRDNGGDGATIQFHEGVLVVRAPQYIHRQLAAE